MQYCPILLLDLKTLQFKRSFRVSKIIMFFIYGWHETENINEDNAMTIFQIKKYDLLVRDIRKTFLSTKIL